MFRTSGRCSRVAAAAVSRNGCCWRLRAVRNFMQRYLAANAEESSGQTDPILEELKNNPVSRTKQPLPDPVKDWIGNRKNANLLEQVEAYELMSPHALAKSLGVAISQGQITLARTMYDSLKAKKKYDLVSQQVFDSLLLGLIADEKATPFSPIFNTVIYILEDMRHLKRMGYLSRTAPWEVYTWLVHSYASANRTDKVYNLSKGILNDGLHPPTTFCNVVMMCLAKAPNHLGAVRKMFEYLQERTNAPRTENEHEVYTYYDGPSVYSYLHLIHAYTNKGKLNEARVILNDMNKPESTVRPIMAIYNMIIQGYAQHQLFKDASLLFEEMLDHGFFPNAVTYNSLIDSYAKAGDMESALKLVDRMKRDAQSRPRHRGLNVDEVTYNTLISGFTRLGKMDEAFEQLRVMTAGGRQPDRITVQAFITGYVQQGDFDAAKDAMKACQIQFNVNPSPMHYNILINGYGKLGELQKMSECYKEMVYTQKVSPTSVTLLAVVRAHRRVGDWKGVDHWFDEIVERRDVLPEALPLQMALQTHLIAARLSADHDGMQRYLRNILGESESAKIALTTLEAKKSPSYAYRTSSFKPDAIVPHAFAYDTMSMRRNIAKYLDTASRLKIRSSNLGNVILDCLLMTDDLVKVFNCDYIKFFKESKSLATRVTLMVFIDAAKRITEEPKNPELIANTLKKVAEEVGYDFLTETEKLLLNNTLQKFGAKWDRQ